MKFVELRSLAAAFRHSFDVSQQLKPLRTLGAYKPLSEFKSILLSMIGFSIRTSFVDFGQDMMHDAVVVSVASEGISLVRLTRCLPPYNVFAFRDSGRLRHALLPRVTQVGEMNQPLSI
jgi:hypothetical protein